MRWTVILVLLVAVVNGCHTGRVPPAGRSDRAGVAHVVIAWLREPGDRQAIERIAAASRSFEQIPGVQRVYVGGPVPSERAVVEDGFDVGVVIVFRDRAALQAYETHPLHQQAVREVLQPLVERMVIYDIDQEP